jgi:hypothetical protein
MKEGVDNMAPGSVIVDLAGATGGTCEVIKRGETYVYDNRVTIIGTTDLISRMTWQASSMYYSNNMANLTCYAQGQGKNAKVLHQNRGSCNSWHGVRPRMCGHMVSSGECHQTSAAKKGEDETPAIKPPPKPSIFSKWVFDLASLGEFVGIVCIGVFFGVVGTYA